MQEGPRLFCVKSATGMHKQKAQVSPGTCLYQLDGFGRRGLLVIPAFFCVCSCKNSLP